MADITAGRIGGPATGVTGKRKARKRCFRAFCYDVALL
jgi:hypothetical protein